LRGVGGVVDLREALEGAGGDFGRHGELHLFNLCKLL
jgi:hypothetical protein